MPVRRIRKRRSSSVVLRRWRREMNSDQIREQLQMLRELLPGVDPEQPMSKLEIIRRVIGYIVDLEAAVKAAPQNRPPLALLLPPNHPIKVSNQVLPSDAG